jgi:L-alanine-DL-glutamate epimerase-like enolase superfamily enzyme
MAMHFAGSPISYMANVHTAAATENFIALEHHSLDVPWWETLVTTTGGQPLFDKGFAPVPDTPGLGVELNADAIKAHLRQGATYFQPTPEWDKPQGNDRPWS